MTVGIVGLGLIGGSLAKAYQAAGETVLAQDTDRSVLDFAMLSGTVSAPLTAEALPDCDLLLLAICPEAAIRWFRANAPRIGSRPVVIDCCGTKRTVCAACFPLAAEQGVTFLGGHPMAGNHNSGFKYARANLFHGAPMVLVPADRDDIRLLDRARELLAPVGFGRFSVTTAAEHDEVIAFTSQMAHIASNAYIKSPTAGSHKGFSAGSYKDLTRVAWLNPDMWAELFLENRENLLFELGTLIEDLTKYKDAIEHNDFGTLRQLLDDGRRIKEEVDGK